MEKIRSFKDLKVWQKGIEIVKNVYVLTKQFLYIALGSAAELETQIIIAKEIGLLSEDELVQFSEKLDHLSKMISSLLNKLKQ
jgi:hypothetical protein